MVSEVTRDLEPTGRLDEVRLCVESRRGRGRHADPRTTMRYDRARKNLDRHPNYILAAYMASGT